MNILFAVQGTGNGHLSRAREFIPYLMQHGTLDLLVSGAHAEVNAGIQPVYQLHGLGFIFGKDGGIDLAASLRAAKPVQFIRDVCSLSLKKYDLIINDFEPVTAMAARKQGRKTHGLSHQSAFLSAKTPRPIGKTNRFAEWVFRNYAPCTENIAFHFQAYDSFIETPVIRSEIRKLEVSAGSHCTVYLPAYGDEVLIRQLKKVKQVTWHLFSKHSKNAYEVENVQVKPINNEQFLASLASAVGVLTGGGFESPAEALYLGKRLFVIPMTNQWEQQCNAAALELLGVGTASAIDCRFASQLNAWLTDPPPSGINYPDHSATIVSKLVAQY